MSQRREPNLFILTEQCQIGPHTLGRIQNQPCERKHQDGRTKREKYLAHANVPLEQACKQLANTLAAVCDACDDQRREHWPESAQIMNGKWNGVLNPALLNSGQWKLARPCERICKRKIGTKRVLACPGRATSKHHVAS